MRESAVVPGYRLSRARSSTKVLTTLGLTGLFLGLLSSALLTLQKTGIRAGAVSTYYLGTSSEGELDALLVASSPRPFAELAEITHIHLVGGSLLLFLLCHLLSVCDVSERLRTSLYLAAFLGFILTFSSPWLIVYVHSGFSWMFGPAILLFITSLFVLIAVPLWEMWVRKA